MNWEDDVRKLGIMKEGKETEAETETETETKKKVESFEERERRKERKRKCDLGVEISRAANKAEEMNLLPSEFGGKL